jgi:hypothetical protein
VRRYFLWTLRLLVFAITVYFAGARLAIFVTYRYMQEMPPWLYEFIRFALDHTGNADIREPDDLSVLAIFMTLVVCWLISAVVLFVIWKVALTLAAKRRQQCAK